MRLLRGVALAESVNAPPETIAAAVVRARILLRMFSPIFEDVKHDVPACGRGK
jgi:hypothetical protein